MLLGSRIDVGLVHEIPMASAARGNCLHFAQCRGQVARRQAFDFLEFGAFVLLPVEEVIRPKAHVSSWVPLDNHGCWPNARATAKAELRTSFKVASRSA